MDLATKIKVREEFGSWTLARLRALRDVLANSNTIDFETIAIIDEFLNI